MRHLAIERRGQGPALVLLPGAAADASSWDEVAGFLSSAFELHLVEIAGFGDRPRAPGPLWPAVRDELLEHVSEMPSPPLVVGHSWGGFAGWSLLAVGAPLAGLVVIDSMPALGELIVDERGLACVVAERVTGLRNVRGEALRGHLEASIRAMTRSARQAERVLEVAARSDPGTLADAMEVAWLTDLRPVLELETAGAPVPVRLVLPGDEHLALASRARKHGLARHQVAALPGHRVVEVAEAGHYLMLDRPAELAAIVHELAEGV